jgi:hypothetical protein
MGQPVKLSDALVMEARIAGEAMQRSIAGQVEFWASLGMKMERMMTGNQMVQTRGKSVASELSEGLESVNEPAGRARLAEYLASTPYPHYTPHPEKLRVFFREEVDGRITEGRFVGRRFVPLAEEQGREAA